MAQGRKVRVSSFPVGLHRLGVGNRLVAGFLIVVLGMVAVTALGVIRVGQVSARLTVINELNSVKQRYAINFRGSVHDRAISLRDVVLAGSPAEVEGSRGGHRSAGRGLCGLRGEAGRVLFR